MDSESLKMQAVLITRIFSFLTLGSLFDGIGGWLLAAKHAGVKPVWASEIDDFPVAVTAKHFPEVQQLGDITKINVGELEPVDIICAGSPCQDLSAAGKRVGLEGERSSLFHEAIRIMREMRKKTNEKYPKYFVWENVPGAFSSNKGLDFRAVLEEITKTEIPMPKDNKWAPAGMVEWDGGSIAWRVLDAQYWGVPQRRKRIFLVADFGGESAGEILFEPESVSGHFTEGERVGQDVAADVGASIGSTGWDAYQHHNWRESNKLEPLTMGVGRVRGDTPLISCYDMTHADEVMLPVHGDKSNCLNSRMGTGGNQVPVVAFAVNQRDEVRDLQGKAGALQAQPGMKQQTFCIAGNIIGRENQNGGHQLGVGKDVSFTLNTVDRHAVAVDVNFYTRQSISEFKETGVASALKARDYKDYTDVVTANKSVRRLTPTECERLQGLPDGYTGIEYKGKPAPDSKRYKALGNGMAQPVADWVIKRIVDAGC